MQFNRLLTLSNIVNNYNTPGTWTRLRYTYPNVTLGISFIFDAVVTFPRSLTLGTNDDVATTPSEKLVHADPILYVSLRLFNAPDIFSLFTLSLIRSIYKCVIYAQNLCPPTWRLHRTTTTVFQGRISLFG